ncbi:MAG TPA: SAM-dependent methyltransferase [Microlunatus sp.]
MHNAGDDLGAVPITDWQSAWTAAATGPAGFWRTHRVVGQFRTASGSALFAEAIASLIKQWPGIEVVIEIGAGDGSLVNRLRAELPTLQYAAVDLRTDPAEGPDVDWRIGQWDVQRHQWQGPAAELLAGLNRPTMIICAEWLDELPCPVARWDGEVWHELLARADGSEVVGGALRAAEDAWLRRWWPAPEAGARAESGLSRDLAWTAMLEGLRRAGGLALMIDYGHTRGDRPFAGSLTGFVDGRQVAARPDPMINLTAHVAVDAVAAAGEAVGAATDFMIDQRTAINRLLPRVGPKRSADVLDRLQLDSERRMLTETLGDHHWLLQRVVPQPTRHGGKR